MNTPTPSITTYRRHSDAMMRWRMLRAASAAFTINIITFLGLFQFNILNHLFPMQALDPYATYDKVILFLFITVTTIVFLLLLYSWKVKQLLMDIQRIATERDKERDGKNRRQKLESLGLLAAGISHEINSCLQTILGSCELAQAKLEKHPEESVQFLQRAIDNSLHARKVVAGVLTFSTGGSTQKFEILNFGEVVDEAVTYSLAYLPPKIRVEWQKKPGKKLFANLDRVGFVQTISNLIVNAAQAMGHEGTITVSTGLVELSGNEPEVTVDIKPGSYVYVSVKDTGSGIKPDILEKIFDPFFTTKPIGEGTGLGLSIVHGLIRSMNGAVNVRSMVGIGSEFTIYLPSAAQNQPDQVKPEEAPHAPARS